MNKIWQNYNLSIVLAALFLLSWIGQAVFQYQEFSQTQQAHLQPVELSQFVPEFLSATLENWQSEFLQLLTMVVLTSFLIHKGSAESKDSNEQLQAALARIEQAVGAKNNKSS